MLPGTRLAACLTPLADRFTHSQLVTAGRVSWQLLETTENDERREASRAPLLIQRTREGRTDECRVKQGPGVAGVGVLGGGEGVHGVREGLDTEDGVAVSGLQADLPVERPDAGDTVIGAKGAEVGMVGRREVFVYGILPLHLVGGEVADGRKGGLLVLEDEVTCVVGGKFHNDWTGRPVFGRNGKGMVDWKGPGGAGGGNVTGFLGKVEDG